MNNDKFYKAWKWLSDNHEWALDGMNLDVVKVNPISDRIDSSDILNTKIQYWIEGGLFDYQDGIWIHDERLDCEADTFEELICKYAKLVKKYYKMASEKILKG